MLSSSLNFFFKNNTCLSTASSKPCLPPDLDRSVCIFRLRLNL
jgi:hypothetical protein